MSECGFPDHHPPPLQVLIDIMNEMLEWIAKDDAHNVLVVHCLAGKVRALYCCYAIGALRHPLADSLLFS